MPEDSSYCWVEYKGRDSYASCYAKFEEVPVSWESRKGKIVSFDKNKVHKPVVDRHFRKKGAYAKRNDREVREIEEKERTILESGYWHGPSPLGAWQKPQSR